MLPEPVLIAYFANAALGVALLTMALLVLRYREGPGHAWLVTYFGLVGADYLFDAVWKLTTLAGAVPQAWTVAEVMRKLDPPTLLLFAFAATGRRLPPAAAALLLLPSAGLVLVELAPGAFPLGQPFQRVAYTALLLACYLGALGLLTEAFLRAQAARDRETFGVLVTGLAVLALSRVALVLTDLKLRPEPVGRGDPITLLMEVGLWAAYGVFAYVVSASARGAAEAPARRVLRSVGALLVVLDVVWLLRFVPSLQLPAFALLYSARWYLFLAVVVASLSRHGIIGVPAQVARWFRHAYATLLFVLASAVAASLISWHWEAHPASALAAGAVASGAAAVAIVAIRVALPRHVPDEAWRRAKVYRVHVALGKGAAEREQLRRSLGLSPRRAKEIERLVAAERAIPTGVRKDVEPGRVLLDRYAVEKTIGVGAFGRTYDALDLVDGSRVVIKELLDEWRADPEALVRFCREAELVLGLSHPNLVGFRGVEVHANGHLLILEHVEGETLARRLQRGPLTHQEAAQLACGLLAGLGALHERGVIHRDVKPENVVLRPGCHPVLLDFGSALPPGATRQAAGPHPGTPLYMSPEQARGEPLTPASDLYSAGLVLWQATCGALPPAGTPPEAWRRPLMAALRADPPSRFQSAAAFFEAIPPAFARR